MNERASITSRCPDNSDEHASCTKRETAARIIPLSGLKLLTFFGDAWSIHVVRHLVLEDSHAQPRSPKTLPKDCLVEKWASFAAEAI
jgi:hypothetical protein